MSRLQWGNPLDRVIEAGLDRGVLYTGQSAVPWNGLVSVAQNRSESVVKPVYQDGVKTGETVVPGDYKAQLNAYTYPDEFLEFDGYSQISSGFYADEQTMKPFGLSYRTFVGANLRSLDYKIHLVYNAVAQPSDVTHATLSDVLTPTLMQWTLTTTPLPLTGFRGASHFIIDSRQVDRLAMGAVERMLWGSEKSNPRLPTPEELRTFFNNYKATGYGYGSYGHTNYGHGEEP